MLDKKFLKFGTAGVVNTGVDWGLYFLCSNVLLSGDITAKIIGAIGGVTSAFMLSALWVFGESFSLQYLAHQSFAHRMRFVGSKYLQTVAVYSVGMLINVLVFTSCMRLGLMELLSLACATGFSFIINFFLSKKFVFQAKPAERTHMNNTI